MTIDKSITELEILKKNTFSYMPAHQAFTTAVNIMHKYQKIQKIINTWHHDIEAKDFECMAEIADVVEDEE